MGSEDGFFEDREDAGRQLSKRLAELNLENPVVVTIPPRGVPVACEVARELGIPLEPLVVLEVTAPLPPAEVIGFVVGGAEPHVVMDEERAQNNFIPPGYIVEETRNLMLHCDRIRQSYRPDQRHLDLKERDVILVCDIDVSVGQLQAAEEALMKTMPRSITLAMPVIAKEVADSVPEAVRQVIVLQTVSDATNPSLIYRNYADVAEDEAFDLMKQLSAA